LRVRAAFSTCWAFIAPNPARVRQVQSREERIEIGVDGDDRPPTRRGLPPCPTQPARSSGVAGIVEGRSSSEDGSDGIVPR